MTDLENLRERWLEIIEATDRKRRYYRWQATLESAFLRSARKELAEIDALIASGNDSIATTSSAAITESVLRESWTGGGSLPGVGMARSGNG